MINHTKFDFDDVFVETTQNYNFNDMSNCLASLMEQPSANYANNVSFEYVKKYLDEPTEYFGNFQQDMNNYY